MAYALCISAGVLPPSSVLPITGAEIAEALSRIPYDKLSLDEKAAYDDLMGRLEFTPLHNYDKFGIDPTPLFSFDAFARSGESGYENDLLFKREDRMEAIDPIRTKSASHCNATERLQVRSKPEKTTDWFPSPTRAG